MMMIPMVQYTRPNGEKQDIAIRIDGDEEMDAKIASKLDELEEHNIKVTFEPVFGKLINVCLDDGEFDFKFEVFTNDAALPQKIADLVLGFDADEYRRTRSQWELENNEG